MLANLLRENTLGGARGHPSTVPPRGCTSPPPRGGCHGSPRGWPEEPYGPPGTDAPWVATHAKGAHWTRSAGAMVGQPTNLWGLAQGPGVTPGEYSREKARGEVISYPYYSPGYPPGMAPPTLGARLCPLPGSPEPPVNRVF